jgi:hypothetical protein
LFQAATASDSEEVSDNDVGDAIKQQATASSKLRDASTFDPDAEAARRSRFSTHASANRYIEVLALSPVSQPPSVYSMSPLPHPTTSSNPSAKRKDMTLSLQVSSQIH